MGNLENSSNMSLDQMSQLFIKFTIFEKALSFPFVLNIYLCLSVNVHLCEVLRAFFSSFFFLFFGCVFFFLGCVCFLGGLGRVVCVHMCLFHFGFDPIFISFLLT